MKRLFYSFFILIFTVLAISSCNDDDYLAGIPENLEVQNFIWKGLNAYYFWQQDMPDLADQRFTSQEQLNDFLSGYSDPEELFYSLLNDYPNTDKYSWIVDDYIALDQLLQEGIIGSNGVEFGLVYVSGCENGGCNDIFGYVRYIIADSDASTKDIHRGDIFNAVNGTPLTVDNYRQLLFSTESYTLNLADFNDGNPISNDMSVDLTKTELQENPILTTNIIEDSGKKIGYLIYNSFTPAFDNELNNMFLDFKSNGVTDLVLDLRYNSGGSVRTSKYLASMITGQFTGELFIKEQWNDKWQLLYENNFPERLINNFTDQISGSGAINSLNLDNIVIITTGSSASASELIINGLNPYINVTTIGTITEGKVVGSVTLYDSEKFGRQGANPNHTWAMQPIALETQNKLGDNHPEGITPTIEYPENFDDLGMLGDPNEPLLSRAITFIATGSKADFSIDKNLNFRIFTDSKKESPTSNNMYVDLN